jgi:hypothetical protein
LRTDGAFYNLHPVALWDCAVVAQRADGASRMGTRILGEEDGADLPSSSSDEDHLTRPAIPSAGCRGASESISSGNSVLMQIGDLLPRRRGGAQITAADGEWLQVTLQRAKPAGGSAGGLPEAAPTHQHMNDAAICILVLLSVCTHVEQLLPAVFVRTALY